MRGKYGVITNKSIKKSENFSRYDSLFNINLVEELPKYKDPRNPK